MFIKFPGGAASKGSSVVTAVAWFTVALVQFLAWELLHATSCQKKKRKEKESFQIKKRENKCYRNTELGEKFKSKMEGGKRLEENERKHLTMFVRKG